MSEGGDPDRTYIWFRDGIEVPGETFKALTIHPVLAEHDGQSLRVATATGQGTISSNEVILRVQARPAGVIQLADVRANYLVLTPAMVFWTNDVGVYQAPIECAYPITTLYERSSLYEDNQAIAVSNDEVFWSNGRLTSSMIARVPIGGGSPAAVAALPRLAGDLLVVGDTLFVADFYSAAILRVPLSGEASEVMAVGSYPTNAPDHLASDGVSLYWWDAGARSINSTAITGGVISILATNQEKVWGLTVHGGEIFWTNELDQGTNDVVGTVSKLSTAGGDPVVLVRHAGAAFGIAADERHVYWTTHPGLEHLTDVGAATLRRVARSGGAPEEMAGGLTLPWTIGVAADYVYVGERPWTSPGRVIKVSK